MSASSTVYVIHRAGKFWRRRHGHARSSWVAGLSNASLYRRVSDVRRACTLIEAEGPIEVWEVEMKQRAVVLSLSSHPSQNRDCPAVADDDSTIR